MQPSYANLKLSAAPVSAAPLSELERVRRAPAACQEFIPGYFVLFIDSPRAHVPAWVRTPLQLAIVLESASAWCNTVSALPNLRAFRACAHSQRPVWHGCDIEPAVATWAIKSSLTGEIRPDASPAAAGLSDAGAAWSPRNGTPDQGLFRAMPMCGWHAALPGM